MTHIAVVAEQFPKKYPFKGLINAIRRNRFNWERYASRGTWYGLEIQTQRLVCSYGIIGYEVYIYMVVAVILPQLHTIGKRRI